MKYASLTLCMVIAALVGSCATPPTVPDDSCAHAVEIVDGPKALALHHIDQACLWWNAQTDLPIDLGRLTVAVTDGEPSRSRIYTATGAAKIYVDRRADAWPRHLHHEIWHVLLWRAKPSVEADDHHRWMMDHRLCQPARLCGYWSPLAD